MRITAYNQISQVYGTQKVSKSYGAGSIGSVNATDKVSFSNVGRDMHIAKAALNNVPDVREDKVAQLKASIAGGTYQVSPESFADKLIAAYDARTI